MHFPRMHPPLQHSLSTKHDTPAAPHAKALGVIHERRGAARRQRGAFWITEGMTGGGTYPWADPAEENGMKPPSDEELVEVPFDELEFDALDADEHVGQSGKQIPDGHELEELESASVCLVPM